MWNGGDYTSAYTTIVRRDCCPTHSRHWLRLLPAVARLAYPCLVSLPIRYPSDAMA